MLLDTSALAEVLTRKPGDPVFDSIVATVDDSMMFASPIHLGELADLARRRSLPVDAVVQEARRLVDLVPLDVDIAVAGSALKAEARQRKGGKDFSLIDGIGLASARSRGLRFLTFDTEFEGFPDATILRRPG